MFISIIDLSLISSTLYILIPTVPLAASPFTMGDHKTNLSVKLTYTNWNLWDCYVKSTIRRKNAYVAFNPEPITLSAPQQVVQVVTGSATATPSITVIPKPSAEEMKAYCEELKEWKTANNVTEILKQSSGSSAYSTWIELIYKKFKETLTFDNFKKHLTFYHLKNTSLIAINAGFDDSFLVFLLLYLFNSLEDPVWSMASTNIAMSDVPINLWSFNQIAGKLREALHNCTHPEEVSTSGNNQLALNAVASKLNMNCYSGLQCTYPDCCKPKTHPTEKCWVKEREDREKEKNKKHKAKKVKKKADSGSKSESGSDPLESDTECTQRKCHHAKMLRTLKATVVRAQSYCGKVSGNTLLIVHPDSGALNHMTHKMELFNQNSFKKLSKPIPVSLGDNSKILLTGKGMIRLMFNVDGKKKEGKFKDVLYVPDLKVTLLSIGQSACLPHCKVVFDNNMCKCINKNSEKVIACAYTSSSTELYMLDVTPVTHKVVVKLVSSSSQLIDINILHRHLGHLGTDNCCAMVKCQLVDGIDGIVGKEEFCEGCPYG